MKPPTRLVRCIAQGTLTVTEFMDELRSLAPLPARFNRQHSWWKAEGNELIDLLGQVASGRVHLSPRAAAQEAVRVSGRVHIENASGVTLFRVLPLRKTTEEVTEHIIGQAMPAEMVEPSWDDSLPCLRTFRQLAEHQYLRRLVEKQRWNLSAAAREAAVSRQTLTALVQRHGLQRPARPKRKSANISAALRLVEVA